MINKITGKDLNNNDEEFRDRLIRHGFRLNQKETDILKRACDYEGRSLSNFARYYLLVKANEIIKRKQIVENQQKIRGIRA